MWPGNHSSFENGSFDVFVHDDNNSNVLSIEVEAKHVLMMDV
jgi:hypothetical protein